jgi:hypothetical protein
MLASREDIDPEFYPFRDRIRGFTMTSLERQYALYKAVQYVCDFRIEGSFVECGVYRGGSSLLAALTFAERQDLRDLWLYDTFAGMTAPTEFDVKPGRTIERTSAEFAERQRDDHNDWCYASLADVKTCLARASYPAGKLHFVAGDVKKTIPGTMPDKICILRLDTDFYDSTKHELEHLYDRLVSGGILIIDDYGAWEGARKAVDEYFAVLERPPLLIRIDETARVAQKPCADP